MEDDDNNNIDFIDDKEFQAKFMLSPDIRDEANFNHLDKNLAITNLKYEKNGINEPEEARSILRGLHILNNTKYFRPVKTPVFSGYREVTSKDQNDKPVVLRVPEYTYEEKLTSKFPKTFHSLKAEFYSFVNTSASRQGHRIKAVNTRHRVKEETIEERNTVNKRWSGNNGRHQ